MNATQAKALVYEAIAQSARSLRNDGFVEEEISKKHRPMVRALLGRLAFDAWAEADQSACMVCGCTEDDACEGGCSWVATFLCSACDPTAKRPRKRGRR